MKILQTFLKYNREFDTTLFITLFFITFWIVIFNDQKLTQEMRDLITHAITYALGAMSLYFFKKGDGDDRRRKMDDEFRKDNDTQSHGTNPKNRSPRL